MTDGDQTGGAPLSMASPQLSGCDGRELRRRVAFAFTGGELMKLAEELGVSGLVRWDRGPQEAASDIVRQFEKGQYGGLSTLLSKLQQAKPLIEWPEVVAAPAANTLMFGSPPPLGSPGSLGPALEAGAPLVAGPPAGTPVGPTIPGAPVYVATPGAAGDAPPPPSYGVAPAYAPPAEPPGPSAFAPPAGGFAPPASAFAPRAPEPPRAAWPGTMHGAPAPAAPSGGGVNPIILVVVAGLMLAAAIVAFLAGRATNASPTAAASASPDAAAAAHPRRPDGPATHIADAVNRAVASVARSCEIRGSGSAEDLFGRVYEECGAPPLGRRPGDLPTRPREPRLGGRDRTPAPPEGPRVARPSPEPRQQSAPAQGSGCLRGCTSNQSSCKSACGSEPNQASKYGEYQACMGHCQTTFTRCRLSCP